MFLKNNSSIFIYIFSKVGGKEVTFLDQVSMKNAYCEVNNTLKGFLFHLYVFCGKKLL